ncbi:MAG: hypothetical protein LBH90_05140 [Tannerella sp.]|jgi:hypothetical protein|nr:hypothetical protein [Tannerella sp.]
MKVRYKKEELCRPENMVETEKYLPHLEVYAVRVKEKQESVPENETPVEWTL